MAYKTLVVVSGMVDATIKEYQPDIDFKLFKTIGDLDAYLEQNPIRAEIVFFTQDTVAGSAGSAFNYMKDICTQNAYLVCNRVIYITSKDASELNTLNYLIQEFELDNWEIIQGNISRTFIQEVVNGTFREDVFKENRKAVVRSPRADYVKEQLKQRQSLEQEYVSDDEYLANIPDEPIPEIPIEDRSTYLEKVYIAGIACKERTAFTLLAAQYLSRTDKVLILESDPEYHLLTEFVTKANIDCYFITVTDIYNDINEALNNIRKAKNNLVVIGAIDRIGFDYRYLHTLLYFNLMYDFDYIITEMEIEELPHAVPVSIVIPSTITDTLATGELVDKSLLPYVRFVGVDLCDLPETHVNSGLVLGKILDDILTEQGIQCPVITLSSLRLGETAYDLGNVIGGIN